MTDIVALKAQRAELDKLIQAEEHRNRAANSAAARKYCDECGLQPHDVFPELKRGTKPTRASRRVKFRHPHTGETWTGCGFTPRWVKASLASGVTLQELAV